MKKTLDEVDMKILERLVKNKTQEEIAKELNFSVRTIQKRMRVLEEYGFLKKLKEGVWEVDYDLLGITMLAVNFISIYNAYEHIDTLIEHLKRLDFVEQVFEIAGSEYNLCFITRFKNLEEYIAESRKFFKWLNKRGISIELYKVYLAAKKHKEHKRTILF